MQLQDVLKLGRRFKRNHHSDWLEVTEVGYIIYSDSKCEVFLNVKDLEANDWFVEELKKNLSLNQIMDAIKVASTFNNEEDFTDSVAVSLGFKESFILKDSNVEPEYVEHYDDCPCCDQLGDFFE